MHNRDLPLADPHRTDSVYFDDGKLHLIDQTMLPSESRILEIESPREAAEAIRRLSVRGAMAIGVAGAYGVVLGAVSVEGGDTADVAEAAREAIAMIAGSRPTARNLFWALERMEGVLKADIEERDPQELIEMLESEAGRIASDTVETNRRLVDCGQSIVQEGAGALTHCHSGALAALRYGTALGVLIEAHRRGKGIHVFVDETRPLLQGARITAWEMEREGVPYTLIPDSAAGVVMSEGRVDLVITGADRIAANGDTANKVGTYTLAVLSRAHDIPFYIAAPGSTIDLDCPDGAGIVIEERSADEVRTYRGVLVAPREAPVYNPAFDVTPADLIEGIVTEKGVMSPPYSESLSVFGRVPPKGNSA